MSRISHAPKEKLVERWRGQRNKRVKGNVGGITDPTPQPQNVHASTKSASEIEDWDQPVRIVPRAQLIDDALAEAERVDIFIDEHDKKGDDESHGLIQRLMYVIESFEIDGVFDEAEFERFLEMRKVRPHGNAKVPLWQPLVKAFRTPLTKPGVAWKRTRVIAALRHREVKAKDVLTQLATKERIGPHGSTEGGMERFVWVFKKECARPKPPKPSEEDEDTDESEAVEAGSPPPPDSDPDMDDHELIEQVRDLLSKFVQRSLFTKEAQALLRAFEDVDGQAPVVSAVSASANPLHSGNASSSEAWPEKRRLIELLKAKRA